MSQQLKKSLKWRPSFAPEDKVAPVVKPVYLAPVQPGTHVVIRAEVGEKYFIWKGMTLDSAVKNVIDQVSRSIRQGYKPGNIMAKLTDAVEAAKTTEITIRVVLETIDPTLMLIREHEMFQEGKNDPNCLNIHFDVVSPKWVPDAHLKAFNKYLQKLAS